VATPCGFDAGALLSRLSAAPKVTVVVPVHNGGETVDRCLNALLRHTPKARLVVIDDASTDAHVVDLLDRLADSGDVELVRHDRNLGYTRTANHALDIAAPDDVVLLNSDTEVGPGWLERLRWVAYSSDRVASVTAVSDNAGAMAVPTTGIANKWPEHLAWGEIARFAARTMMPWAIDCPTGNGFCLYLRRAAIDTVGYFDEVGFPRGYGEENDWCMRALGTGFRNLLAPHVLVRHARGQSFGQFRDELVRAGRRIVDDRHPSYTQRIHDWMDGPEMALMRSQAEKVRDALAKRPHVLPRRLSVVHRGSGGTPATNRDLLTELDSRQESFLLECDRHSVTLFRWSGGAARSVASWRPETPFTIVDDWREDYARFLTELFVGYAFETIHVRHLLKQPLGTLPRVAGLLGIPLVLSTHDFYYVCPTVHLLDERDRFCGGTCTAGEAECRLPTEFVRDVPPLKHRWVHEWRRRAHHVLRAADAIVATTPSAAAVYDTVFGEAFRRKARIIEHGRTFAASWAEVRSDGRRAAGPLRVLAPAQWSPQKGVAYLRELARRVGPLVEWHVVGRDGDTLADVAIVHGRYERDNFPRLAREIDPDFIGLFSISPETYSHTLTEAWALGIPVLATDIGAVGDRVRAHGGGVLLPHDDLDTAARVVESLARTKSTPVTPSRPSGIRARQTMAEDYRQLYDEIGRASRALPTVGCLVPGDVAGYPASTHVRILRRLAHPRTDQRAFWRLVDPHDLVSGADTTPYDAVLVQRDAIPSQLVKPFLERLSERGARLVVEVDDDLVTPEARTRLIEQGYDPGRLDGVRLLLSAADGVLTSCEPLAARLQTFSRRVTVVPNQLDPRLWCIRVPTVTGNLPDDEIRLLYMGTRTHQRDLALLRDVVPAASRLVRQRIVVEVVGVTDEPCGGSWLRRLPVPAGGGGYPDFVRWLRTHAHRWNAAVAPLADDAINSVKSDLKLLEYAMLGLSTIASRFGPYAHAGHLARLTDNDTARFARALALLLQDPEEMQVSAKRARERVVSHRMLSDADIDLWCDEILGK
jgi:GT2 family glycosyltransferase/glycosyltransferase involved in cell wall biosynthesis